MSQSAPIRLPILVSGELVEATGNEFLRVDYDTGASIEIPKLDAETVTRITAADRFALADLHVDDITIFLGKLGKLWADRDYPLRRKAVELAHRTTGVSREIIEEDYDRIGRACDRAKLYDLIETDLDTSVVLDDWVPRQSVYVRTQPKGRVLHVLVGNVPLAGLFTLVRSVLTKNVTVAKLPSRDMISSLFFALAFRDVDAQHPVTRSLSVVFWPGGSEVEQAFIDASDLVCAWGQQQSMTSIKRKLPAGTDFLEFGPKRSLSLVGAPISDLDDVCMRAAYDASVYDQEACFSTQRIFVEGNAELFASRLAVWFEKLLPRLPAAHASLDKQAHLTRTRQEAKFEGWTVLQASGPEWTVIVAPTEASLDAEHPLGRTVFVHPVQDLRDALPYITRDVQTVSVSPWSRGFELANELTRRGVLRVTELGLSSRPRPGFVHDGTHPLRRMVNYVCVERGLDYKGKFRGNDRNAFKDSVFLKGRPDEPGPSR
jgi:long-chain-fatty-acyl-CoA reductase